MISTGTSIRAGRAGCAAGAPGEEVTLNPESRTACCGAAVRVGGAACAPNPASLTARLAVAGVPGVVEELDAPNPASATTAARSDPGRALALVAAVSNVPVTAAGDLICGVSG